MTYYEAKAEIASQQKILSADTLKSIKPHRILGTFICPRIPPSYTVQLAIFTQVVENKCANDMVLQDLGLMSNELEPFVCLLIDGRNTFTPLATYIKSPLSA